MNRRLIRQPPCCLLFSLSTVGSSFNAVQDERIGRPVQDERIGRPVQDERIGRPVQDERIGRPVQDERKGAGYRDSTKKPPFPAQAGKWRQKVSGYAPLLPGAADDFLAGGRPSAALPGPEAVIGVNSVVEKPAQARPAIRGLPAVRIRVVAVALADSDVADRLPAVLSPANFFGRGGRPRQPFLRGGPGGAPQEGIVRRIIVRLRPPVDRPVGIGGAEGIAKKSLNGLPLGCSDGAPAESAAAVGIAPGRTNDAAHLPATGDGGNRELVGVISDVPPLDPLGAPPFLPGELKDAVNADPGNSRFSLGQPALLGGDETPELAAFPEINGVVPLVAIFAGFPGLGLSKGIGLVDAAVEGLAPVFRQGFQDGRSPVGVGKGLPIGAVPGDAPGLSILIPPPQKRLATGLRKAGQAKA